MSQENRDFTLELSHLLRMGRIYADIERMNRRAKAQEREGKMLVAPYTRSK